MTKHDFVSRFVLDAITQEHKIYDTTYPSTSQLDDQVIRDFTEAAIHIWNLVSNKLAKQAENQALASEEQVKELHRLVELLSVPCEMIDKWLTKSESSNFSEMPADIIQKCIDSLKSKIEEK